VSLSDGMNAMWKMDIDSIDFVSIYSQINYGMITLEPGFLWLTGGVYAKCSTIGRKENMEIQKLLARSLSVMSSY